jgi:hypothetical protein
MAAEEEICILCAWRENCQKKFFLSGKDIRCPDFVRDSSIKKEKSAVREGEKEGNLLFSRGRWRGEK